MVPNLMVMLIGALAAGGCGAHRPQVLSLAPAAVVIGDGAPLWSRHFTFPAHTTSNLWREGGVGGGEPADHRPE